MNEASRLSRAGRDLIDALDVLGDALVAARPDVLVDSEALIEARVGAFRRAAADAVATGDALTPDVARAVTTALERCRRLGASLARLGGSPALPSDAPRAYTPVGQPLLHSDGGSFLTARG